jgi:catechol 2,3-dioxygenase-like lactoylglutathione lyase family enzyme
MPKLDRATPILRVADVTASVAYYRERLGFDPTFTYGDPPGFGGVHRDGVEIFFCREAQGNPGTWMSLWVDDVDALHDELRERGAEVRQPPTTIVADVTASVAYYRERLGFDPTFTYGDPPDGVALRED